MAPGDNADSPSRVPEGIPTAGKNRPLLFVIPSECGNAPAGSRESRDLSEVLPRAAERFLGLSPQVSE